MISFFPLINEEPVRVVFSNVFNIVISAEEFAVREDRCCGIVPGIRLIEVIGGEFERVETPFSGYRISI